MSKIKSINLAKTEVFSMPIFFADQATGGGSQPLVDDTDQPVLVGTGPVARRLVGWNTCQVPIGIATEPTFIIGFSTNAFNDEIANAVQVRARGVVGLPGWQGLPELFNPRIIDYNAKGQIVRPGDYVYLDFSRCAKGLWSAWAIGEVYEASTPAVVKSAVQGSVSDLRQLVDILLTYQGSFLHGNSLSQDAPWLERELMGLPVSTYAQPDNFMRNRRTLHLQEAEVVRFYTTKLKKEQPSFVGLKLKGCAYMHPLSPVQDTNAPPMAFAYGATWTDSATGSANYGQKNKVITDFNTTEVIFAGDVPVINKPLGEYVMFPDNWLDNDYFDLHLPGSACLLHGTLFYLQNSTEPVASMYNLQISKKSDGEYYLHADDGKWLVPADADARALLYATPGDTAITDGSGTEGSPYLLSATTAISSFLLSQTGFYQIELEPSAEYVYCIEVIVGTVSGKMPLFIAGLNPSDADNGPAASIKADVDMAFTNNGAFVSNARTETALCQRLVVPAAGVNALQIKFGLDADSFQALSLRSVALYSGKDYLIRLKLQKVI